MEYQIDRVVSIYIFSDAIGRPFHLRRKCIKHSVPNDQRRSIVSVKIVYITRMMNTVMTWGYEYIFNRCRQFLDHFCMDPKLVEHRQLVADEKYEGVESHHDHRYEKDELDRLGPSRPK